MTVDVNLLARFCERQAMALHCKLGRAARPIGVTDRAVGAACRDLAPEVRRTERIRAQARSEYTSAIVMTMTVRGRAPSR